MDREEILKAIMELPKENTYNPISTMNGINVDDLISVVDKFDKIPTYQNLLNKNVNLQQQLKKKNEVIEKACNYCYSEIDKCKYEQSDDEWECCIEELKGVLLILEDKEVE